MMCSSFMFLRWEARATVSPAVRIRHKVIGYKLTSVHRLRVFGNKGGGEVTTSNNNNAIISIHAQGQSTTTATKGSYFAPVQVV